MRIPLGPLSAETRSFIITLRKFGFDYVVVRRTTYGIRDSGAVESAHTHPTDVQLEADRLSRMYPPCPQGGPGFVVICLADLEQTGVASGFLRA